MACTAALKSARVVGGCGQGGGARVSAPIGRRDALQRAALHHLLAVLHEGQGAIERARGHAVVRELEAGDPLVGGAQHGRGVHALVREDLHAGRVARQRQAAPLAPEGAGAHEAARVDAAPAAALLRVPHGDGGAAAGGEQAAAVPVEQRHPVRVCLRAGRRSSRSGAPAPRPEIRAACSGSDAAAAGQPAGVGPMPFRWPCAKGADAERARAPACYASAAASVLAPPGAGPKAGN
jgi:hypothetical protein